MLACFRRTVLLACLGLLVTALPLCAVTTAQDVQRALENAKAATPKELAPLLAKRDLGEMFGRLRTLRSAARDFAIASMIVAGEQPGTRKELLEEATGAMGRAGLSPVEQGGLAVAPGEELQPFVPWVTVRFFAVSGQPEWLAAEVVTGVPCGRDVSLLLWRLKDEWAQGRFRPELTFARESAFEDLASSSDLVAFSVAPAKASPGNHVAFVESAVWCNSQWKRATFSVYRPDGNPFRPHRLFRQEDLAFFGGEFGAAVLPEPEGFRFEYAGHYWLNPLHHSRRVQLQVRIDGERAWALPPASADPIEFLDQWLASPWDASRLWTTGRHQHALRTWHQALSPAERSRTMAEVAGKGGCQHDPETHWVRLTPTPRQQGQGDVFGLLRKQTDGFRLDQFVEELPPGCPARAGSPVP
jgi:hypothetical protein